MRDVTHAVNRRQHVADLCDFDAVRLTPVRWCRGLGDDGEPGGAAGLVGGDVGVVAEGDADVVEAFEQAVVVEVLELERLVEVDGGDRDAAVDDVDDDLDRRVVLDRRA